MTNQINSQTFDITLSPEQVEELNSKGYITIEDEQESLDLTYDHNHKLVKPLQTTTENISQQEKKITDPVDVIWTPYYNQIHKDLKVSQYASCNNGEFFFGKAESGSYVMFCKVLGSLDINIILMESELKRALKEASEKVVDMTVKN